MDWTGQMSRRHASLSKSDQIVQEDSKDVTLSVSFPIWVQMGRFLWERDQDRDIWQLQLETEQGIWYFI